MIPIRTLELKNSNNRDSISGGVESVSNNASPLEIY
jgi:hypothetical protein